jgi:hypothetical protein
MYTPFSGVYTCYQCHLRHTRRKFDDVSRNPAAAFFLPRISSERSFQKKGKGTTEARRSPRPLLTVSLLLRTFPGGPAAAGEKKKSPPRGRGREEGALHAPRKIQTCREDEGMLRPAEGAAPPRVRPAPAPPPRVPRLAGVFVARSEAPWSSRSESNKEGGAKGTAGAGAPRPFSSAPRSGPVLSAPSSNKRRSVQADDGEEAARLGCAAAAASSSSSSGFTNNGRPRL